MILSEGDQLPIFTRTVGFGQSKDKQCLEQIRLALGIASKNEIHISKRIKI